MESGRRELGGGSRAPHQTEESGDGLSPDRGKIVEERVLELHQEKKRIVEDVLEGTGRTALSPELLIRLFSS